MIEAIEPVKRKKKVTCIPPPLPPLIFAGSIVPHALVGALLDSATRVAEASNENFHWQKKKHDEGKRDEALRAHIRRDHHRKQNKNLSPNRVAIIQGA
ncbi:MAG: hypothetical protein P0S96_06705 [Simkaniaceae bacterium]|nr:hypothetical protein [Candidatus Sacchlamyda saccharinae]